jgi:mRNA interferase MazF
MVREFEVYLVNLDQTIGLEIKKSLPCVVLFPNEMNSVQGTVIIAPMTTSFRRYPLRVEVRFQSKFSEVMSRSNQNCG